MIQIACGRKKGVVKVKGQVLIVKDTEGYTNVLPVDDIAKIRGSKSGKSTIIYLKTGTISVHRFCDETEEYETRELIHNQIRTKETVDEIMRELYEWNPGVR